MKTYLVEKSNQALELMHLRDVAVLLQSRQINPQFRIYDEDYGGWIPLWKHPTLAGFAQTKPQAPVTAKPAPTPSVHPAMNREWYYLQGQKPVGAFSQLEMIRMMQAKKLDLHSSIWKPGQIQWQPISTITEFHSKTIQQIHRSGLPGVTEFFEKRHFPRFNYNAKFVLHDENRLWKAHSYEIGMGGVGFVMDTTNLSVGQELYIHQLSRGDGLSLNAVGMIRSLTPTGLRTGQVKAGFEFVDIGAMDQKAIQDLSQKRISP